LRNKLRRENKCYINNLNKSREFSEDKFIEIISMGPTEEDLNQNNFERKTINLEVLKPGDMFPCYFCVNKITLDVDYISESPCEVIIMKISDIQELFPVNY